MPQETGTQASRALITHFLKWADHRGYILGREVEGGNDPFAPISWNQPATTRKVNELVDQYLATATPPPVR